MKFLSILTFLLLTSCLPESGGPVRNLSSEGQGVTNPGNNNSGNTTLPVINYFQLGTQTTNSTLNIASNYQDSFLLRGKGVSSYLQSLINPFGTTSCLVVHTPNATKKIVLLRAIPKSFLNYSTQKNEFYFQFEAQNEVGNASHCLTSSMIQYVSSQFSTNQIATSLETFCPTCINSTLTNSLRLVSANGEDLSQVSLSHLSLNILHNSSIPGNETNTCSGNSTCIAQGYNCCLEGQCVNHGAVKSGVNTQGQDYLSALEVISNNPSLIVNYPEIFYVCPTMVPSTPGNNPPPTTNPAIEAQKLTNKLRRLYQCLNPIQDEFSLCSLEFPNAPEIMASGGVFSSAEMKDDLTIDTHNSIVEVIYGGKTYYKQKLFSTETEITNPSITFTSPAGSNIFDNGALTHYQSITANLPLPPDAIEDSLYLTYKVDGSCEKLGTALARCTKSYVQGQPSNPTRPSDHASGNLFFDLPRYANLTNLAIKVEVGGLIVTQGAGTWNVSGTGIQFYTDVYDNQVVKITYFVSGQALVESLTYSKDKAQQEVNTICACDTNCNLTPTYDENNSNVITGYSCTYQGNQAPGPLQKIVYLSAKSVPHRFYDQNGTHYRYGQIPESSFQEGTPFKYKSNNTLRPDYDNGTYIGFNEIYGTMGKEATSPMPATIVDVEKGKTYQIFTEEGVFSTCLDCGTDPYAPLVKLFPQNFSYKGGGYRPDMVESRRRDNLSKYSADDKIFGRACFVPATMIPWTHVSNSDIKSQRRNRLAAQHFLFANGYNRDWYGFDYGSVIGSFDGVKWFAIGNERKILATSKKLFLALNAYFGDVTIGNNFTIMVNETSSVVNSGSFVDHDLKSDGAECQKAHICSTDRDCAATLGYDYSCQNVSSLMTTWPMFDNNGDEIVGSNNVSLLSLVGGANGQAKRCVYRGRGALCEKNPFTVSSSNSYSTSTQVGLNTCSGNNYCEDLNNPKFNTRIARYANSLVNQNNSTFVTDKTDTFGFGARILGRPYDFYGTQTTPAGVKTQLQTNNAHYMCVPGKTTLPSDVASLNDAAPTTRRADKMFNVGIVPSMSQNESYYASAPAVDNGGYYLHNQNLVLSSGTPTKKTYDGYTVSQNISTKIFDLPSLSSLNLFNDMGPRITTNGLNQNTSLKAAGAPCLTDLECGPSTFIASKINTISDFLGDINEAEQSFLKEGLVCANNQDRYVANSQLPNPYYDISTQKCCRETNKKFTYYTARHGDTSMKVIDSPALKNTLVPGYNQPINDPARYSSNQIVFDKLLNEPSKYPPLYTASELPSSPFTDFNAYLKQFNTLQEHNSRMCCSNHWVRSFASGVQGNGGGHKFTAGKQQNRSISSLTNLNWLSGSPIGASFCDATDYNTSACLLRNIPEGSNYEKKWLDYFGRLELLGIPQILIPEDVKEERTPGYAYLSETIDMASNPEVNDSGKNYFQASAIDHFSGSLKRVFSDKEFNCCMPTGVEVSQTTTNDMCCSGQVYSQNNIARCCLNDFTDLSVYTNAYVSSEGYNNKTIPVNQSDIDSKTGYIKKEKVMAMAKTMCCSGEAAYGVAISTLFIPIGSQEEKIPGAMKRRFVQNDTIDNDASLPNPGISSKFEAGLKWNDHVYCVPQGFNSGNGGSSGSGSTGQ